MAEYCIYNSIVYCLFYPHRKVRLRCCSAVLLPFFSWHPFTVCACNRVGPWRLGWVHRLMVCIPTVEMCESSLFIITPSLWSHVHIPMRASIPSCIRLAVCGISSDETCSVKCLFWCDCHAVVKQHACMFLCMYLWDAVCYSEVGLLTCLM